jgi:hypothetical protein
MLNTEIEDMELQRLIFVKKYNNLRMAPCLLCVLRVSVV